MHVRVLVVILSVIHLLTVSTTVPSEQKASISDSRRFNYQGCTKSSQYVTGFGKISLNMANNFSVSTGIALRIDKKKIMAEMDKHLLVLAYGAVAGLHTEGGGVAGIPPPPTPPPPQRQFPPPPKKSEFLNYNYKW